MNQWTAAIHVLVQLLLECALPAPGFAVPCSAGFLQHCVCSPCVLFHGICILYNPTVGSLTPNQFVAPWDPAVPYKCSSNTCILLENVILTFYKTFSLTKKILNYSIGRDRKRNFPAVGSLPRCPGGPGQSQELETQSGSSMYWQEFNGLSHDHCLPGLRWKLGSGASTRNQREVLQYGIPIVLIARLSVCSNWGFFKKEFVIVLLFEVYLCSWQTPDHSRMDSAT